MHAGEPHPSDEAVHEVEAEAGEEVGHPVHGGREAAEASQSGRRSLSAILSENRFLVAITFGTALVVGVFLSILTGSWLALVAAMLAHVLATLIVVGVLMRLLDEQDKPDPVVVANMQEQGLRDPERAVNEAVRREQ